MLPWGNSALPEPVRAPWPWAARNGTAGAAVSTIRDISPSRRFAPATWRSSRLKWAFGYPSGTEFGQPTVVDGRLFVTSSAGRIYSLDSKTGCTYWTYDAAAGSRTAVTIGELARARVAALPSKLKRTLAHLDVIKAPSAAFFGDDTGAVYALDAQKGTLLWKTQVDTHPLARIVGAPTLYSDRLYVAVSSTEDSCGRRSELQLLHLSRQRGCARHRQRPDRVEELHRARGAAADPQEQRGHPGIRPGGCGGLLVTHHRCQAQCACTSRPAAPRPDSSSR